jgi:release factor glutamine methyltransferase
MLDAKLILAHVLGIEPGQLAARDDEMVSPADIAAASAMIERRRAGEPVARIIGEKEFWSLPFRLSPATMVPRPDTETVVSTALEIFRAAGRAGDSLRLLDLGTGSGCILLALLSELPAATGLGTDRGEGAVVTAAENAERLGLAGRARFAAGNWADGIDGPFDAILANPPYVEDEALPALPVEVIGHDPRLALSGGADGIEPYRAIIPELPRLLVPGGFAVLEFGPRQGPAIREIAVTAGMATEIRCDLAGRERVALLTLI